MQESLSPLVASPGRNPILPAQRSEVLLPHRSQSKLDSLFHRFTFLPWHAEVFTPSHHSKSVTYVLNLLCIRCPEPAPPLKWAELCVPALITCYSSFFYLPTSAAGEASSFLKRGSLRIGSHSQRYFRSLTVMLESRLSTAPGVLSNLSISGKARSFSPTRA
jgi:hypothetical protein